MRVLSTSFVLLALVSMAAGARQDPTDPLGSGLTPSQRLEALLERMRSRHEALDSLEAEFVQSKESMMFLEPSVASGVFSYAAPDSVRWEYEQPDPISLLITDGRMTTWYRDLGRAETSGVEGHSQRIMQYMGASTSVDTLVEYFDVSLSLPKEPGGAFRLHLTPRFKRVEKRVRDLEVWIDSELYLPLRLRFVEGDGDVTEYEFSNLRLNQELPEGRFTLEIPDQVEMRSMDLGD
jgi:outer membrane lipoprotein-sorting protein